MSATWFNGGIDYLAQLFLGKTSQQTLTLRLFTNNHTPVVTDTWSAFTECSLTGYSAYAFTPADWSGLTAAGLSDYTHPAVNFNLSPYAGGTTIYGYVLTIPGITAILGEKFGTAYAVPAGGGVVAITPEDFMQQF